MTGVTASTAAIIFDKSIQRWTIVLLLVWIIQSLENFFSIKEFMEIYSYPLCC